MNSACIFILFFLHSRFQETGVRKVGYFCVSALFSKAGDLGPDFQHFNFLSVHPSALLTFEKK